MKTKNNLTNVSDYVRDLFHQRYTHSFYYHNFVHTREIVRSIDKLATGNQLNKKEKLIIDLAGWFSDIFKLAYWENAASAADTFKDLLKDAGLEDLIADEVFKFLSLENEDKDPDTLSQKIFRDSSHFYWTKESFDYWLDAKRQDILYMDGGQLNVKDWNKSNLSLLQSTPSYTSASKTDLKTKLNNIKKLEQAIANLEHHSKENHDHQAVVKNDDSEKRGKAAETMFKITSNNNQRFTSLGDNKAHILITVNSIILSIIISILLRKLDESSYLIYPTFLLLSVTLASIVFAILATRPSLLCGRYRRKPANDPAHSLLFFGNFHKMDLHEYSSAMIKLMDDNKMIYQALINDNHGQAIVLGKKYTLLRIAYNIFMLGLVLSVVVFVAAFLLHQPAVAAGPVLSH